MHPGEEIHVRALKADGTCYRSWYATIESADAGSIVTTAPIGATITDRERGQWQLKHILRSYYWFDLPYNLIEVFDTKGQITEIYINVASKPEMIDGVLHFTDHELDVSYRPPAEPVVVDEDEFEEAITHYNYSETFQREARQLAQHLLEIARNWQVRKSPYPGEDHAQ